MLSNICFLTRSDNNTIKDKAPATYLAEIDASKKATYLRSALCPDDFSKMDYAEFVKARTELLKNKAQELMV